MRRKKYKNSTIITALKQNNGMLTYAAKQLNCSWRTISNYIKNNEDVAAAYEDILEQVNDIAENVVRQDIIAGSVETAKWYLRYKAKHRGYVDKDNTDFIENSMVSDVPKTEHSRKLGIEYLRALNNEG